MTHRLANISTRGLAGNEAQVLIAGFVITGATPKEVLIRAVGPTLSSFGVSGALASTHLGLFSANGVKLEENSNWSASSAAGSVIQASLGIGAFPLASGSKDATLLTRLDPGGYTAVVKSADGGSGIALIEVYEAIDNGGPKLINISTRGQVNTGSGVLIAGFVIAGNAPKKVLVRAIGPTLQTFGVGGSLLDPVLTLFDGASKVIAENNDWSVGNDASTISTATAQVGAFALQPNARDAALLIILSPGAYTAQAAGAGNSTGISLIEVYEVP